MFKQAFRLAFVALIWKQYKSVIISTILLFAYLFLISNVHGDYLEHLKLQDQSQTSGLSFVYKWLAYAAGIALYFLFHWWRASRKSIKPKSDKVASSEVLDDEDDPFAQIRQRKQLRSRADFLEGKD